MTTDDEAMRNYAKRLFSHPEQPHQPDPKPAGHVAREGGNPDSTPPDPMREFVADLFGADENARGRNNTPLD